jgi:peptidoglycan L-alanyl-D-glutamate endopeptidase CwlK
MADWMEVVEEAKRLGFFWGGDFRGTFKDQPHLEMAFGLTIRQWLGGSRPSQAAIAAILEKINGEDDEEMTAAEKEAFKALQDKVAALEARSAADPILPAVPDWAQGAVKRAIAKHAFTDPKGTHDFYRLVVILDNLGYFK